MGVPGPGLFERDVQLVPLANVGKMVDEPVRWKCCDVMLSVRGLMPGVVAVGVCARLGEGEALLGRSAWRDACIKRFVVPVSFVLPERAEQTRTTRFPESRNVLKARYESCRDSEKRGEEATRSALLPSNEKERNQSERDSRDDLLCDVVDKLANASSSKFLYDPPASTIQVSHASILLPSSLDSRAIRRVALQRAVHCHR